MEEEESKTYLTIRTLRTPRSSCPSYDFRNSSCSQYIARPAAFAHGLEDVAAEGETEEDAEDDAGGEGGNVAVGGVYAGDQGVAAGLDLVDLLEGEWFVGHDCEGVWW